MSDYDLSSLKLPVLTGTALKLFASSLENPLTRSVLMGTLLESGGILRLRKLDVPESPLTSPLKRSVAPGPRLSQADLANGVATPDSGSARAFAEPRQFSDATPRPSISAYAQAYRDGTSDPVKVTERILAELASDRKARLPLNPFIAVNDEELLRNARESAKRIREGDPRSVLEGVPVAIKDEVDMTPYPTTVGTSFLGTRPAASDATTVERLRAAGALLIGKANMHEIGINPTGHNVHFGHTRNPHAPQYDTGGSSSGPATAVAGGFAALALGADGGGSIRVPASLCGIYGLKPTYGRVSEHGAAPLCWSVGHLGPLATTVADLAMGYGIIAGPDDSDHNTLAQPGVTVEGWDRGDLKGVTLGVYKPWFRHADADVVAACEAALGKLEEAGAVVREVTVPGLDAMRIAHAVTILVEMATAMEPFVDKSERFGAATRINLLLGRILTGTDYLKAQRIRARGMDTFDGIYRDVDAIITPTTAVTAQRIPENGIPDGVSDLSTVTELMRYAGPGNLLGMPAISIPVGHDRHGLPIGLQAMGRHWEEHLLLRIAGTLEKSMELSRPKRFVELLG